MPDAQPRVVPRFVNVAAADPLARSGQSTRGVTRLHKGRHLRPPLRLIGHLDHRVSRYARVGGTFI